MKSIEPVKVVQVGATGPVAEMFRDMVARPDMPFELEAIATADNPDLRGKKLGETALVNGPDSLGDVPIIGILDAVDNTDAPLVFSGLRAKLAARYEDRLAEGRLVVTNASANRTRRDVPLVSGFTNVNQIDQLFGRDDMEGRIIAGGNCMSAIISVPLAPIHRTIGIERMTVRTLQGWSGAGMREVPEGVGNSTQPIEGDEQEKIQTETNEFLGSTLGLSEGILIGAEPRRAPWLRGHYAVMALNLSRETSTKEVEDLLRQFKAPEDLEVVRPQLRAISRAGGDKKWPGRHHPIHPVKLEHGDLVRSERGIDRLDRVQPMRVHAHVVSFDPEDPSRVVIEVSGDNLIQGAVGSNLLNAMYARAKGYIGK